MRRREPRPIERLDGEIRHNELLAYRHYGLTPTERFLSVATTAGVPTSEVSTSEVSTAEVRVLTFGEPNPGPPVLLLHGIASVNVIAAPLLTHLTDRRVIAVDWPGHGLSDESVLPVGAGVRAHAVGVIRSILDALDIAEVDIVGHSMGAQFGLYAASELGPRIRRLVTLGAPGAGFLGVRPIPMMRVLAVPHLGRLVLRVPMSPAAFVRNNEKALGAGALRDVPPPLLTAAKLIGERPGFAASIASYFRALVRLGSVRPGVAVPLEELATLEQPTMLVWGDDDVFMTTAVASASIAAIRDCHLIRVPHAGHAPWLQEPGLVGAAVAGHLR
jgi:pimeloyl-ACP methyl ester carboxylesterase